MQQQWQQEVSALSTQRRHLSLLLPVGVIGKGNGEGCDEVCDGESHRPFVNVN